MIVALAGSWGVPMVRAPGQNPPGLMATEGEQSPVRVHPPTDRILSRGMRRAEESIAAGEFSQALRFLDELLGHDEDYFIETGDRGAFAGMKESARRMIRDLPPEGRRAYEATYGPVAERLLRATVASGDAESLEQVVHRYLYTAAGSQAALLLAANEADAGRHLVAALLYQQLLETPDAGRRFNPELSLRAAASWLAAGDADQARRILAAAAGGASALRIAGRDRRIDARVEPIEWLRTTVGEPIDSAGGPERQWLTYRGNAARNGAAEGGLPHLRVRWNVRLMHGKLEELFSEYKADIQQSGHVVPVASAALAAGDYVLVRTPQELLAVDFRTGKRVWRSQVQRDPEIEQLVRSGSAAGDDMANAEPAQAFVRRMWEDYMYGIVSSDGERVYAIRDLPMPASHEYEMSPFMNLGAVETATPANRLSAYDLGTEGTLVWEIDGAAASDGLNGAFFLGAPLAMGSSLYVLMEIRDEVYVAALDAATGQLQWRQQLANLEAGVLFDLQRRLQAAMPSYDAGMLVCPTGAGLVVGVDMSKRSLAWAYRFETIPGPEAIYGGVEQRARGLAHRWTDAAATIVDGRVLLTPPESNDLHCLDLRTGRLVWKRPRGEMLRLACVHQGKILLVGNRALAALRLEDGQPTWSAPKRELPRGAAPAGNGFVSDGKYFMPLTTAEVVAIDLGSGRIVSRVAARDGTELGNLICHRGTIISQNGLFLDCFDQVDVLRRRSERRLAENADDVDALRSLGEIAYNEGRLSDALGLLERAFRASPDDLETRDVLAECLANALDGDFAAYRARLPLLKELEGGGAVSPRVVLRLEAQGLLQVDDPVGAAAACLALYRSVGDKDELMSLNRVHESLASRWVQSQLAEAWDAASDDQRKALEELVAAEIGTADAGDGEELGGLFRFFGSLPQRAPLKLSLARQLDDAGRTLEAQQLLLDLTRSADASIRREAVARIASQLHDAQLHSLAFEYDRTLADEFADEVCLGDATGRELVDLWAESAPDAHIAWPAGKVVARDVATSGAAAAARMRTALWSVRLEHGDSILGSGAGYLAMRGGALSWHDRYGREFFTAAQPEMQANYRQAGSISGMTRGNLLIVSLGREVAAFNTLPSPDGSATAMLWRANLGSTFEQDSYYAGMGRRAERRPGSHGPPRTAFDGEWIGVIGPVFSGGCVIQDQRRLMCVEPVTGEMMWSRTDVPPGCDLFGDERYVFATPFDSDTALIYSAIDGRLVGKARVPAWSEQLLTHGRTVVRWSKNPGGQFELAAADARTGAVAWRRAFDARSRVDVDLDRFIAVVEPQGRATVIDAQTGAVLVDQPIDSLAAVEDIHLSAADGEFVLVVQRPQARNVNRTVRGFNPGDSPTIDGQVYVFERPSGAMRWNRPADVLQQALVPNQPDGLPFITFAGMLSSNDRGAASTATVLVLDKATGRTLYARDDLPHTGIGYCLARASDPAAHEASIELAGRTIVLKFTDDRRPPEPPAMAEVESTANRTSGGVLRIILNLGGGN
jgi:outer membrane protein assembly factor BamB